MQTYIPALSFLLLLCCLGTETNGCRFPLPHPPPRDQQKAAVATDYAKCSQIGSDILLKHGSAVDSAIASMLCLGVVDGESCGMGGGFYMVIYNRSNGYVESLDALETAYGTAYPEMRINSAMGKAAIPGEVRGMWDAHQKYGKLPWRDLFAPAIDIARNGFVVSDQLQYALDHLAPNQNIELRGMYRNENTGRLYRSGDTMTRPALADTLEAIAENGVGEFYTGQTAAKLVNDIKTRDGSITLEDLANYTAIWRDVETLEDFSPSHYTVYSSELPSSGPTLQFILRTLDCFDLPSSMNMTDEEKFDLYHRFLEVCKFAIATGRLKLADASTPRIDSALEKLRSPAFSEYIRSLITSAGDTVYKTWKNDYSVVFDVDTVVDELEGGGGEAEGDTSHISVLAWNGDAVSVTTSVGAYFGCKEISPSTGLILNHHMVNFDYESQNNYARISSNKPVAGRRHLSYVGPSVIIDQNGDAKLIVGAAGGSRISAANAWVIMRTLLMNVPLGEAIEERRIHSALHPNNVAIYERKFPEDIYKEMKLRGHNAILTRAYIDSTVQGILRDGDNIVAHSDSRKGGKAIMIY